MYLNLHRLEGRPDHGLDNVRIYGPVIASAVMRHLEFRSMSALDISRATLALLTTREQQVCDNILEGRTSEGIALTLGISIHTVNTLRKRAYAKLRISSQNELARLSYLARGAGT